MKTGNKQTIALIAGILAGTVLRSDSELNRTNDPRDPMKPKNQYNHVILTEDDVSFFEPGQLEEMLKKGTLVERFQNGKRVYFVQN